MENTQSTFTWLHLGLGAFHRAHQAWYLNRLIESGDARWTLVGANIRNDMPALLADLQRQNGEYTLETVTPAGEFTYERIRSISKVLPWAADLAPIIDEGRRADTRIISFTVTESGYYQNQHHELDLSYADLRSDVETGSRLTIYGAIAAILAARREDNAGPVTLMCCDNIRSNGEHFLTGLLDFLKRRGDTDLIAWVQENTSCPNAMVDRITPRPPAEARPRTLAATGVDDACVVMGESFCQWVIEDHFCNGRPDWEKVGVQMVESVLPYEEAKIRILNATHSCIAWAGALRGYQFIHEGVDDASIRAMAFDYVTEDVIACLTPSPVDLPLYRDTVLDRFSNPYIRDTIERVAADGFAKIPGFMTPTIVERLEHGQSFAGVAKLPALFLLFLQARAAGRIGFDYKDQAMDEAVVKAILAAPPAHLVHYFCANALLWGGLASSSALEAGIANAYAEASEWLKEAA
jgi:D-arabinitol 4-dehydrogenase